ncbi:MAG: hypothetical protein IJF74_04135 [Clostridia bacterium]|nr:hypothetical protein [Clostridia bacterium]
MLSASFIAVLNMSITASIVIIIVLFARLLLKGAPKIFSYALWAVVLFRLICPISFTSELSLMHVLEAPVAENGKIEYVSFITDGSDIPSITISSNDIGRVADRITKPSLKDFSETEAFDFPVSGIAALWVSGAAVMLIFNIIQLVRLSCKLIGATPLRENIYLADHISTPFVLGVIRPKIYLPSSASAAERTYIILHEKHHILRGDNIIKLFAFAAMCLHWFNPLVWIAFVLAGKDMEMSCDEAVLKQVDTDIRADYSSTLLHFSTGKKVIIGTPLAFGEGDTKERIKNIMKYRKPTFKIIALALVMCIGFTACLSANPQIGKDQSDLSEIAIKTIDLSAETGVGVDLAYESEDLIIFYGNIGLFGYDLNKKEILFAVDLMKAVGVEGSIQGSRGTSVEVSVDGKTIVVSDYDAEDEIRRKTCYIDVSELTYSIAEYEPLSDVFERDTAKGYIYPGVRLEQVKYIADGNEWVIFGNN